MSVFGPMGQVKVLKIARELEYGNFEVPIAS